MNNDELVFKFKEYLKVLNRSPSTIKYYTDYTKEFLDAAGVDNVKTVTRSVIETYIATLYDHRTRAGKPHSNGTICLKVRAIKRFFGFLATANIIFIDPAEAIKEPQKQKLLAKRVLSRKQTLSLLDQPNLRNMGSDLCI